MLSRPPNRASVRPALLLPLLSLACTTPPPNTTPDLPQASIVVDEPSTVGTSLKLSISTSGCEQVQRLELLDNDQLLKTVTYAGNPTPVELAMNEVHYTRGIAAVLSLTARVTCSDGRTNVSQAQPATFFPVEEVVQPDSADTQVVPDYFVAEGSGASVSFIGCANDSNGRPFLYKVQKSSPSTPQKLEMPFACDATTIITDRRPAVTGTRWVWTPDKGAFALSANFTITGISRTAVDILSVAPDGNAFLYDKGAGATAQSLQLVTPKAVTLWGRSGSNPDPTKEIAGFIAGEPLVRGDGSVVIPLRNDDGAADQFLIQAWIVSYQYGNDIALYSMDTFSPADGPTPPIAFDPTGKLMYVATQGTKSAYIRACSVEQNGPCDASGNRVWLSPDLSGTMVGLLPYANGSRLAVMATNRTWFLDSTSNTLTRGSIVNKDQQPLTPTGALVPRFVQPGLGNSVFYQFNSAAGTDTQPNPYPVEILATDAAEKGELYRYQVPGGSLYGALDDAGTLWLRVGRKLVKPLAPEQYRQVR